MGVEVPCNRVQSGGSAKSFVVLNPAEGLAEPLFEREGKWKRRKQTKTKKKRERGGREEAAKGLVVVLMLELGVKYEADLLNALLGERASIATYLPPLRVKGRIVPCWSS